MWPIYVLHSPICRHINGAHRVFRDFLTTAVQLRNASAKDFPAFVLTISKFYFVSTITFKIATYKKNIEEV